MPLARRASRIHLPALHPAQQEIIDSDARFVIAACGRRFGKSDLGVHRVTHAALTTRGGRYGWIAPIYPQARLGWHFARWIAAQVPGAKIRDGDLEITYRGGGTVVVRSSHDPDSLRGEGLNGVVLEEAAYQQERVWPEIVRPMLATTRGWALFLSSPAGLNWFARLFNRAVVDGVPRPGWARFQMPTSANPMIGDEEIEDARQELPAQVFAQEYLAMFVDKLGELFKAEWFRYYALEADAAGVWQLTLFDPSAPGGTRTYPFGKCRRWAAMDPALSVKQSADYTALVVVCETPDADLVVLDVRRVRMENPELIDLMVGVAQRWQPTHIAVEAAVAGLAVIQHAQRLPQLTVVPIPVKGDKTERATPVAMRMRAGKVYFDASAPWLRALEYELLSFPPKPGDGAHDDQVDALAYCDADRLARKQAPAGIRVFD